MSIVLRCSAWPAATAAMLVKVVVSQAHKASSKSCLESSGSSICMLSCKA